MSFTGKYTLFVVWTVLALGLISVATAQEDYAMGNLRDLCANMTPTMGGQPQAGDGGFAIELVDSPAYYNTTDPITCKFVDL